MNAIRIADRIDAVKGKRIHVFVNGNADSFGQQLLINSTRERTWNKVLTHVTQTLEPSYGIVRHLIGIDGKESVHSFSELSHGARYVARGKEQFKKVAGGYRTESEYNRSKKKKCSKLYPKQGKTQEITEEYWALSQAEKNKRTVIYVFSNGHRHHAPVKFVLIDSDFRNWPRTLSHISNKLDKPEGIHYLYTIYGKRVCGPCEIQHGACYVATAFEEKFQKLNYMDSYRDLILMKQKSGETVKQFNIGAISSPMGLKIRNDDCFFARGKPTTKRKQGKRSTSSNRSSEKRLSKDRKRHSSSKRSKSTNKKYESENAVSGDVPPSNEIEEVEGEAEEEKDLSIKSTVSSLYDINSINEVTIEAVGFKVVADRQIKTNSQITQTFDKNQLRQNDNLHVINTPECGIRVVGADEISKRKHSNKPMLSSLSPAEEYNIIEEHNKNRKDRLNQISELTKNHDDEYVKVQESAISFSYVNQDQVLKDLNLGDSFTIQKAIAAPHPNKEEILGIVERKSAAILDRPEIILNSNEYSDDKERIPVNHRRSTGFNLNFGSNMVTPCDDDHDDDKLGESPAAIEPIQEEVESIKYSDYSQTSPNVLNIAEYPDGAKNITKPHGALVQTDRDITQESKEISENNEHFLVDSELMAVVNCSDASTQGLEQLKEKAMQIVPKETNTTKTYYSAPMNFITSNDASNQEPEQLKEETAQTNLPKETKSTGANNISPSVANRDKLEEQEPQGTRCSKIGTTESETTEGEPQGTKCSKIGTTESETTEGKRIAIASEVQQLLQKGDKIYLKLCDKIKETSPKRVQNMQNDNELNKFKRAYQTGIIKDAFCLCKSPFLKNDAINEQYAADNDTGTRQNYNQTPQGVKPLWSTHSTETQTESFYSIPNSMDQKHSTLKFYVLRSGTYNEFLEMPYDNNADNPLGLVKGNKTIIMKYANYVRHRNLNRLDNILNIKPNANIPFVDVLTFANNVIIHFYNSYL